ncbi:MAG: aminomethyl-transferring glycine dehydrogenase [Saprospiraceae bacterium]|nr:aminomethyl-transferring glycine dehydrogenase [Saprospiraceae bacterium]
MATFSDRHIGPKDEDKQAMLSAMGLSSLDELIAQTIPGSIRRKDALKISSALSEYEYLKHIKQIAAKNIRHRSYIGLGYSGTVTPPAIQRNILENPGWYTQYTPYQAEISQGRLEALLNFQTVISDLTGLPIANASLLDEATAAAEAMTMAYAIRNKRASDELVKVFFVDEYVFPQTIEVLKTRARPLGIELKIGKWKDYKIDDNTFGVLLQYPNGQGEIEDYQDFVESVHAAGAQVVVAADLLSLVLLSPPGEWGADIVVGSSQRFGVPMGYGGPHAAYFATIESNKRQIPGRIIGVSVDVHGNTALRMALQTREQHIRREKATSNICTAQALLAIMASMYAVYHGPEGLKKIATAVLKTASIIAKALRENGWNVVHNNFFDTVCIKVSEEQQNGIRKKALEHFVNFYYPSGHIQISVDETTTQSELDLILKIFDISQSNNNVEITSIPASLSRTSNFLEHPVFHNNRTETKLMRYIKSLENKDLSLMHAMIPLGSCTMKLNAATQLIPISWDAFAHKHPFAPEDQVKGYLQMIEELADDLCEITGFEACSFQPNSGAQGEYAGLLVIKAYHEDRGEPGRNVALIPSSAHGTNPASAVMAGMEVVIVRCDEQGNIDVTDLLEKAQIYEDKLSALMVTYPSTHGVFEKDIIEICKIVHDVGGLVYMDGANMNAQVGLTSPALIGADVCHLNLHKTFAIPHGGGGPGMGPICVNGKLKPFLPCHLFRSNCPEKSIPAVAAAPYGSANILLISYAYIKLLGAKGLTLASQVAILNANYLRTRLEAHYSVLYVGDRGYSAHELILDLRPFKEYGVDAEDVAKRLIDYGFHAPTLSFPVAGTLMIEPTESEDLEELDRFCDAMIQIRQEISEVAEGIYPQSENVLVDAPHTIEAVSTDDWQHPYNREKAAFPLAWLRQTHKFWAPVGRVDNAYGDRNLVCTCPPIEAYQSEVENL